MEKIYLLNLYLMITGKCGMKCRQCLVGDCPNRSISDEVIVDTFNQIKGCHGVAICGGEPLLAFEQLVKTCSTIVDKRVIVDSLSMFINGTIYNPDFFRLLDYIEEYISKVSNNRNNNPSCFFAISDEEYHRKERERLKLEAQFLANLEIYSQSKYFRGLNGLNRKLVREGRAEQLPEEETVPLKPVKLFMNYYGKSRLCYIGPLAFVNINGTISEHAASYEHQETIYNYGNVCRDSIEQVCLDKGAKVLKYPSQWVSKTNNAIKSESRYYGS